MVGDYLSCRAAKMGHWAAHGQRIWQHQVRNADVIREAVSIGGDTDTIACMAGAISGAFPGAEAIPLTWLQAVREVKYPVRAIEGLADQLFEKYAK